MLGACAPLCIQTWESSAPGGGVGNSGFGVEGKIAEPPRDHQVPSLRPKRDPGASVFSQPFTKVFVGVRLSMRMGLRNKSGSNNNRGNNFFPQSIPFHSIPFRFLCLFPLGLFPVQTRSFLSVPAHVRGGGALGMTETFMITHLLIRFHAMRSQSSKVCWNLIS